MKWTLMIATLALAAVAKPCLNDRDTEGMEKSLGDPYRVTQATGDFWDANGSYVAVGTGLFLLGGLVVVRRARRR